MLKLSSKSDFDFRKTIFAFFLLYQVAMYVLYTQTTFLHDELKESLALLHGANIWLFAVAVIFLAPIIEEFIFRRVLFNFLLRINTVIAILMSSFLWALVHFKTNLLVSFMLFTLGGILALTRIKSKSIRLPILLHAINNAIFLFVLQVFYI
ncbi:CPBP family intramembrane glutamic endopeptidase [Thalassomonas sp. RHCl1]|uniref:CPBP family intramembrane glutamic endopeptidase n=1 Tax=Thalassomonas sp. RHCl1 TaxID=2995320 RepID=UPI00248B9B86|nr:CPBP family intramembrane glutamic endopeptidase [Thalassomonas sp. RHCl1]